MSVSLCHIKGFPVQCERGSPMQEFLTLWEAAMPQFKGTKQEKVVHIICAYHAAPNSKARFQVTDDFIVAIYELMDLVRQDQAVTASDNTERVDHPAHYSGAVECIQLAEHMSFNLGNALKYVWRFDKKADALEDLEKARWYFRRELHFTTPRSKEVYRETKQYD